jgi:hypothetical protein
MMARPANRQSSVSGRPLFGPVLMRAFTLSASFGRSQNGKLCADSTPRGARDRRIPRVSGSCAADLMSGPLRNLFVKQAHTSCTRDGVRDAHHSAAVVSADGKWSVAAGRGRVRRRPGGTCRSLSKRAVAGAGSGLSRARVGHSSDTRVAKALTVPKLQGSMSGQEGS